MRHCQRICRLQKVRQVSLILRPDIQLPTQRQKLHHRQGGGHLGEFAWRRLSDKTRGGMKVTGRTLILFEVVHRRLQQRQSQHLERTGFVSENT
ncbi:hypothetical protein D9M71_733610 [compost metagenome]